MRRLFSILAVALFLSAAVTASAAGNGAPSSTNPPIIGWRAPAFYTSPPSGRAALTDAAPPMPYIPLVPCRQFDSRATTKLADNTPRTVTLSGAPCGIPATAAAVALNITVINILGAGSNGVFKVDTVSPPLTAWINYPPTETQRANAGVVGLSATAAIVVQVNQGGGNVDFVVDVFGYYGATPAAAANFFTLNTNSNLFTMSLSNASITCTGACGLLQTVNSGTAIEGDSFSSSADDAGVFGFANSAAIGVFGTSANNAGVRGTSLTNVGVVGTTGSAATDMEGVLGRDGSATTTPSNWASAGVRGEGKNGVIGISNTLGGLAVLGEAVPPAAIAVEAFGNFSATGTKAFVEPHPADPMLTIRYVALEGPEAGTYFRGTARTVGREAVIPVPETFRAVSSEEGLTVHLTPIDEFAQLKVMSRDLNQIVVRSTREVTFDYLVHGIRRAFKDWQVVAEGHEFRPVSPDQRMPLWLTEEAKGRLISNGTYNADGTVNMRTAERLGWAKVWREEAAAEAAAAAARK